MNSTIILYALFSLIAWVTILYNYNMFLEKYQKNKTINNLLAISSILIMFNYEKIYGKKISSLQKKYYYINSILLIIFVIKLYMDSM